MIVVVIVIVTLSATTFQVFPGEFRCWSLQMVSATLKTEHHPSARWIYVCLTSAYTQTYPQGSYVYIYILFNIIYIYIHRRIDRYTLYQLFDFQIWCTNCASMPMYFLYLSLIAELMITSDIHPFLGCHIPISFAYIELMVP